MEKRIPKKIKLFHGKPLIAYSIGGCYKIKTFSKVIVSTDDEEIAKIAKVMAQDVPFLDQKSWWVLQRQVAVVNHLYKF